MRTIVPNFVQTVLFDHYLVKNLIIMRQKRDVPLEKKYFHRNGSQNEEINPRKQKII